MIKFCDFCKYLNPYMYVYVYKSIYIIYILFFYFFLFYIKQYPLCRAH
jgi:hypothetical protein